MPKYDSIEDYLRSKLQGQRERCDELKQQIEGLNEVIVLGVQQFQNLSMKHGNSRNEIGQLRRLVEELKKSLAMIHNSGSIHPS